MSIMKEALVKAGLVKQETKETKQETKQEAKQREHESEPCEDEVGARCEALVALMGEERAQEMLQRVSCSPYGRLRKTDDIEAAINRAFALLPSGEARRLRENKGSLLDWGFSKASTLDYYLGACYEALENGGYAAWIKEQERLAAAPNPPQPPSEEEIEELLSSSSTVDIVGEYRAALRQWADNRTEKELKAKGFYEHRLVDDLQRRVALARGRVAERKNKQEADSLLGEYMAGRIGFEEAYSKAQYIGSSAGQTGVEALRSTRRAWLEGRGAGNPPEGVDLRSLSVEILGDMVSRSEAVRRELARRLPSDKHVYIVRDRHAYTTFAVTHEGKLVPANVREKELPLVAATEPHPDGWVYTGGTNSYWQASGAEYAAIQTLQKAEKGWLDIRHVIGIYGRHETQRWPRLYTRAWKTPLLVGIDDELSAQLDALERVYRQHRQYVPEKAYWLQASVRKTKAGRLHIAAGQGPEGALIQVTGGRASHGRHGWSGEDIAPAKHNQALAVAAMGMSNGGGQTRSVVIAFVTQGTPLLLDNGVGYVFEGGQVFRVPGLASGRPGEKEPL